MEKLKVMLITREVLRSDSNEGNVLLNLFDTQTYELANIYCKPGVPDRDVCNGRYFQLTDRMALNNILKHQPMGKTVHVGETCDQKDSGEKENKGFYDFFRSHNWEIFYWLREKIWQFADIKSEGMENFVRDFEPDVIFAPMCYSKGVLKVHRYVIELANCPAVTYIYDDIYSLKQLRFSPMYWINRFQLRKAVRKTLPYYEFAYTMCEQQAEEFQKMLRIPMKVLRKTAPDKACERIAHDGIRVIYAGGTYYGRDKTLIHVAKVVRELHGSGKNIRLSIFTNTPIRKNIYRKLNDEICCFVYPAIAYDKLLQEYASSDIALHVESFQKKYAWLTRLSFSTKLVDCIASGCEVVAIGPKNNAGFQYLKTEEAAICIESKRKISIEFHKLLDEGIIQEYAMKSMRCAEKNHLKEKIRNQFSSDMKLLCK